LKGFFFTEEDKPTKKSKVDKSDPCETCGLYKTCISPKMEYTGTGDKEILIIAEAPGKEEDEDWENLGYEVPTQLIGKAGRLVRESLDPLGVDIDYDCWKLNAVNCRPPDNRKPTKKELKCCKPKIDEAIEKLKPKFIWLMGGAAVESFYMSRFKDLGITLWRHRCIPDRKTNAWVIPMFHPSYILRKSRDKNLRSVFERDLKWAVSCLKRERPVFDEEEKYVKILTEKDQIIDLLDRIIDTHPIISFDYETSSLKPYREGNFIRTIGVALSETEAYSFPVLNSREFIGKWRRILKDPRIFKIAQNLKFEDSWSRVIFNVVPEGWIWCTMVASHVLDGRHGATGLKYQSYVRWGVGEYDSEIKHFLVSSTEFNKIQDAPLYKLCLYVGMDVLLTYRLWVSQTKQMRLSNTLSVKNKLGNAYAFFHEGLKVFCEMQSEGIPINEEYYENEHKRLTERINKLEQKLYNSEEAKLFYEKKEERIGLGSPKDLRFLFFKLLKLKSVKKTKTEMESVDQKALEKMTIPFVKNLLKYRKLLKIRDTYLAQFQREVVDGKIHPFFDLHIPVTYRSSSSRPNFQNIPIRDEEAKKSVRSGVIPSPGNKILCGDYKGIEVAGAACITKDPVLVDYVSDPLTDMHRDQAVEIFLLESSKVTKDIRFYAKNGFIFPEFYGSYYKKCAENLWKECIDLKTGDEITIRRHLRNVGISSYVDFEEHLRKVEDAFWEKYNVFAEWKEKAERRYRRKGYVDMPFGFRREGYLSPKEIVNTPIQGTAFHCLLWSLIEINKIRKEENWKTKIMGQIHDEIIYDLDPSEQEHVIEVTNYISCERIRKEHDWIIVPLSVDFEATEIDESWYYKKGIV